MNPPAIDLNCDLGEGAGHDAELMAVVTSASVACGGHTGDRDTMLEAVDLARRHGVTIGAHPSLDDRAGFGRRELAVSVGEVEGLIAAQVGELCRLARSRGAKVAFVKPHGALYNMSARDPRIAGAVAAAVRALDPDLILYGLAGSELLSAGRAAGLSVASEVFADRTYQPDGSLTPRSRPGALILDESAAAAQVLHMALQGHVRAADGTEVAVAADTVCIHGDGPHAVAFATRLRAELAAAGITVRPIC